MATKTKPKPHINYAYWLHHGDMRVWAMKLSNNYPIGCYDTGLTYDSNTALDLSALPEFSYSSDVDWINTEEFSVLAVLVE